MSETNEMADSGMSGQEAAGAAAVQAPENVLKSAKKQFSKLGLMFFLGTIVIFAAQFGVMAIVQAFVPAWLDDPNISLMLSIVPMYLIGMPILILLVKRLPAQTPEQHSMKAGHFLIALVMAFCVMYVSNIIGTIITTVLGMLKQAPVDNVIMDVATSTSLVVNFIYMVICAPILEEFVFRKLIVDRTVRYGQGVAVLLSGLMFGLFHGNLNQFMYAFTLGLLLAFLYVKTGRIKYTIGIHMIINFIGSIISVLLVKGIHIEEYMDAAATGDMEQMMAVVMNYLPAWIAYMVYILLFIGFIIAGIVLFIVFRKRFRLEKGEVSIPRGKRFATVIGNIGMGLYCIFWIGMIIWQLVS